MTSIKTMDQFNTLCELTCYERTHHFQLFECQSTVNCFSQVAYSIGNDIVYISSRHVLVTAHW